MPPRARKVAHRRDAAGVQIRRVLLNPLFQHSIVGLVLGGHPTLHQLHDLIRRGLDGNRAGPPRPPRPTHGHAARPPRRLGLEDVMRPVLGVVRGKPLVDGEARHGCSQSARSYRVTEAEAAEKVRRDPLRHPRPKSCGPGLPQGARPGARDLEAALAAATPHCTCENDASQVVNV